MFTTILLVIIVVIILYFIFTYNRLVRSQNLAQEGWSGIDIQLKLRASLIPNLLETVKGYMGHERGVLEKVTELRSQCLGSGNMQERAQSENRLTDALRQLFAVSENYPDLKASQNFIDLQQTLTTTENQIQSVRRYYNGTVRDLNILIQSFPSNVIARSFHFTSAEFFGIENAQEREAPSVKFP